MGGIAGNFRPLTDLVRHVWVFYIVGYDGERQSRLLYTPMRQMITWIKEKYLELGRLIRKGLAVLFQFQDIGAFISIRGFVVIVPGLSAPGRPGDTCRCVRAGGCSDGSAGRGTTPRP